MFWRDPDDQARVMKAAIPAHALIEQIQPQVWDRVLSSPFALFHARASTKGDPKERVNNHPVIGFNIAVTHNGVVSNDDDLWNVYRKPRFAEVDSSAINLVLSMGETLETRIPFLTTLNGSASFAAVVPDQPHKVILGRIGHNDVHLILYWSSIAAVGRMFIECKIGSLGFVLMNQLADGRVIVLSPDGPDATTSYKLERKPFVAKRVALNPPSPAGANARGGSPIPLGPAGSPVGGSVTPTGTERITIRSSDEAPVSRRSVLSCTGLTARHDALQQKAPTLPPPSEFSWEACDLLKIMERDDRNSYTLVTMYGRWIFRSGKGPEFKPYKSIKKWWNAKFHGGPRAMPEGSTAPFDLKLPLVKISATEKMTGQAIWITHGFACPWCGVYYRERMWVRMEGKCPWCLIKSGFPKES
jgi:hypothetical protein